MALVSPSSQTRSSVTHQRNYRRNSQLQASLTPYKSRGCLSRADAAFNIAGGEQWWGTPAKASGSTRTVQGVLTLSWQVMAACSQSPGEATSFIHFQLSWLEGADGATAPGQELAFGVGLRMEPSISPIACCTHSQAIHSPSPLGSSFTECDLSFGSGVELEVSANSSFFWISKRTPLQVWESILATGHY